MEGFFTVYFKSGDCDLDVAVRSLTDYGLTVVRRDGYVTVSNPGSPEYDVSLSVKPWVRQEAAEIGEGTPHAAALAECDARFEVSFANLEDAIDEMNTLIEVRAALQEACKGFIHLSWNGSLDAPGA